MKIRSFELPPAFTNAYLLSDASTQQALLIDAPMGAWEKVAPILEAEELELQAVLLTHAHFDHLLGAKEFNDAGYPFYLHTEENSILKSLPDQLAFFYVADDIEEVRIDHWLKDDGGDLEFLNRRIEVRRVSGHSPGGVVYYFPDENCAFVGDAIFKGSVGRTDLPSGDFAILKREIIQQIYSLPDDTVLYPGHGEPTTVEIERVSNPYVQG